jgi:O-acetyl-ADP-ribose deacetylase
MKVEIGAASLELVEGDITKQTVDAIVNAANAQLAGGGGVDGAIHRAGGSLIMTECRNIGGCPTGQAVATTAGMLDAEKVIHAVGPIYRDGRQGEPELLASAYRSAFSLAAEQGLKTIATPSLSTGAYGYPMDDAARIAISTAIDSLRANPGLQLIRFVLMGSEALGIFRRALEEAAPTQRLKMPR